MRPTPVTVEGRKPRVSVLMPVYNCRPYLPAAIQSICSQSYTDFEYLIIDDASTDGSAEIIARYEDPRIKCVRHPANMGVAGTLNHGLSLAVGEYVVRMDADDIALPDRIQEQVRFMDAHPQVGVAGGNVRYFGRGWPFTTRIPVDSDDIAGSMVFDNPMCHVTVIMRRSLLQEHKLEYDPRFAQSEDYDLWTRAVQRFPFGNTARVLVRVRLHGNSATSLHRVDMQSQTRVILARMLERIGISPTEPMLQFHFKVGRGHRLHSLATLARAETWLLELCSVNREHKGYEPVAFERAAGRALFRSCSNSTPLGFSVWRQWRQSRLSGAYSPPQSDQIRLLGSIVWHRLRQTPTGDACSCE